MKRVPFLIGYLLLIALNLNAAPWYIEMTIGSNPCCPGSSCKLKAATPTAPFSTTCIWFEGDMSNQISGDVTFVYVNPTVTTTYYGLAGDGSIRSYTIVVNPLPSKPALPTGVNQVCLNTNLTIVSTNSTSNTDTYIWDISPLNAGTITGNITEATINWNSTFFGDVHITVQGENSCGLGDVSDALTISKRNSIIYLQTASIISSNCVELSGDQNATSYLWSNGSTNSNITSCYSENFTLITTYVGGLQCESSVGTNISEFSNLLPTPNGPVYATYENSNKLYFGGDFNYVGNVSGYSAYVNSSDALFDTEMPRINGKVNCVIPDGSGGWYVGGLFTKAGVYDYNNLVHITSSKSIDVAFAPQPNGEVKSLKLVGNKLYAAGSFTMVGEVSRGYLAQINVVDGMASSWDPMVNAAVNSIEVYENKIIAGGEFSSIGGSSRNYLAAVDTVYGQATSWNPSPNQLVNKIVLSGLKLYVAGNFTTISGSSRNRLSCILLSTEALTSWNPNPDNIVLDILPTGSAIYLAGNFNSVGGQTRNYIAAVNTTAGTALSWNPNADNTVNSLYLDESNIIAGGEFSTIGGQTRNCLARLSTTTSLADSWDPDVHHFKSSTPVVNCISMTNGNYYVGGEFYSLGGELRNNVACVDLVSGELSSWDANANNVVRAIYSDENYVYIGGEFTQVNGWVNKNRIAQLDKNTAVATGWNPNSDGTVHALAGKGLYLYVGGEFTNIGNNARPKLAAIKFSDGTSSTFNPSPNGTVRALAVEGDSLFVGGDFTSTSGQTRNRVAGYNLSTSNILSFDPNANNSVNAIATNNNNVFIGGNFSSIAGQSRNNFAIFNMAGSIESANPFYFDNTGINAVVTTDSVVYMGGEYTFYNNNSLNTNNNASAIKNTDQSMSTYWHPEPNNTIRSILISNDKIYLGGDFTEVLSVFQPFFVSVDNYCIATAHIEDPFTSQFCEGDGVYLNADTSSNYSYQWYLNNVQILEADSCSYSPVETGAYTVRITDNLNYGYIFSNGIYVEVDPLADTSLTISGLTEFCGGSVDLVAQTGAGYTYQWYKDNNPISGENTNTLSVTETGTYYAEIYNSSACVQNSQEVYINSSYLNPTITALGDIIFCEDNSLVLSSDLTTGNEWYKDEVPTGITTQNITVTESGTYKTYVNSGSCEGWSEEIIVVVNPLPVSAGTISGNTTVCQGETSLTYTVPVIENSTSYIWTLPTGATGTSTTNSITVDYGISASSSNITVKGNNSCGDGAVSSLAVTVDPLPVEAGTISGNTVVCQGEMSLTYTVPVVENATSYIWTLPTGATGSSNTNSITVDYSTSAVSGNITVKGTNSCGDGVESSLSITVNPLVADAGLISGSIVVCQGENTETYTVPVIENATSYIWTLPTGATGSSNTNSIIVDYSASAISGNITVKGTNSCGDGVESSLSITVNPLVANAGLISGSTNVCQGENSVTYTVPIIENTTSYIWTLPTGATGSSNTNSIIVDYSASAISGNITVKGTNSCGDGIESSLSITVNPLVADAGLISGSTNVCQGENSVTYTVPIIENAISYIWNLPAGAIGSSNTNSITVDYSVSAVSGDITVKGTNSCGDGVESSLSITVNPLVADAGLISGSTNVCQGENSVTYTVPIIENATSYIWTLPTGATGSSDTNSITVDYSFSAVSGDITVKGTNSCGDGALSALSITVNTIPETPIISQIGNSLQSNAEIGNQWYNQSGILPSETSQVYTPLATGEYYTIVTLSGCSSSSSNVISFIYTGIVENNNFASYHIYPNPNNGLFYMEFFIPFTQEIKIEVFNNLGQQVYAISKSYSSGYNIQTIDLSGLSKGVYLIKNNIGGKLNTNKIAVE